MSEIKNKAGVTLKGLLKKQWETFNVSRKAMSGLRVLLKLANAVLNNHYSSEARHSKRNVIELQLMEEEKAKTLKMTRVQRIGPKFPNGVYEFLIKKGWKIQAFFSSQQSE